MTNKPADVRAEDALLSGSLCGWLSCSAAGHFYPQVLLGDRSILTTRVFWGNDGPVNEICRSVTYYQPSAL